MSYSTEFTLAKLGSMTHEDLIQHFPQRHKRWIKEGYKINARKLIQALIYATAREEWEIGDERGPREVWYNPIKPIVLRAVGSRADEYDRLFESELSKLVKKGKVTYADLGIKDFRTLRETYEIIDLAKCWENIVLFVEKDAAYIHLRPLKNFLNINIMSGGGWSNTSGIEAQLGKLKERGITELIIFTVTDYDPFGFAIDREFTDKCEMLGLYVKFRKRVAIGIEHTTPELIDVQKYPIEPGKKLSVNGLSFDSDEWLEEYGIEGKYGLEIESISGQRGGHQHLREIVAKEILKYLDETDRITEITKKAWEKAPTDAISRVLYNIDFSPVRKNEIVEPPTELPQEYLSYSEYQSRYIPLDEDRTETTSYVDAEIADLEEQLEYLSDHREEVAQPIQDKINELNEEYLKSKRVLAHSFYKFYQEHEEDWPREDYDLGYPPGCIFDGIKQGITLDEFLRKLTIKKVMEDISDTLNASHSDGQLTPMIEAIMTGEAQR